MQLKPPRQVRKACERPLHAQWARPAGQAQCLETISITSLRSASELAVRE
jgi:hypothetical protein